MTREPRKTLARHPALRPDLRATGEGLAIPREGQTFAGGSLLVRFANLVRLPHTLFALPFALVGTIYATYSASLGLRETLLVVVAFTAARFAAMGFNRIVDREIDAENPRTRAREIPSGRLTVRQAAVAVAGASVLFVVAAGMLNPLCLYLSVPALAWILGYSYSKRFTSWSHLWLGASLAIAPVGGYLAITGKWGEPWWPLALLSAAVLFWVAGFDIFYALQDREFDREHRLRSAVVLLGDRGSILLAKLMHGMALAMLLGFGSGTGAGLPFYLSWIVSAILIAWEHRMVRPGDLSRLNAAFFTMNGIISIVILAGVFVDRLW